MGKLNISFLYGRVAKKPVISVNRDTGEYTFGMVYIDTVRSLRPVENDVRYTKHDHPLIISKEKEILDKMAEWEENDIVSIKGVVTSKSMQKKSYCPTCVDEEGSPFANVCTGNLVYITPIFAEKLKSFDDKDSSVNDLIEHREISNQIYVMGTLIREPKLFTTKAGIQITQYPLAINRKFTIRTDDPEFRTDYPIAKSYGEQARNDKIYLAQKAEVIIDGFLQARTVTRKIKCKCCEQLYEWKDHAMEIVPYDVEYVSGFRSKDQVEAEMQATVEEIKQKLFQDGFKDDLDEETASDDVK